MRCCISQHKESTKLTLKWLPNDVKWNTLIGPVCCCCSLSNILPLEMNYIHRNISYGFWIGSDHIVLDQSIHSNVFDVNDHSPQITSSFVCVLNAVAIKHQIRNINNHNTTIIATTNEIILNWPLSSRFFALFPSFISLNRMLFVCVCCYYIQFFLLCVYLCVCRHKVDVSKCLAFDHDVVGTLVQYLCIGALGNHNC